MPTYDYECRSCGHRVEVLHGVNEGGPTACGNCGGPMRKLMSTPNIHFKGSGWAKKDARDARPAVKSGTATGKAESSESTSSTESSSADEPAPAAKSGDGAGAVAKKKSSAGTPSAD